MTDILDSFLDQYTPPQPAAAESDVFSGKYSAPKLAAAAKDELDTFLEGYDAPGDYQSINHENGNTLPPVSNDSPNPDPGFPPPVNRYPAQSGAGSRGSKPNRISPPADNTKYSVSVDVSDLSPAVNYLTGDQKADLKKQQAAAGAEALNYENGETRYAYSQWLKNKSLTENPATWRQFLQQKEFTQKLSLNPQTIDLSDYKGNDPAREVAFRALKQQFGSQFPDDEINAELDAEKTNKGGYTNDSVGGSLDTEIAGRIKNGDTVFNYIPQYGQQQAMLNRRSGTASFTPSTPYETFIRELKERYQPTDEPLRRQAIDEINAENQNSLINNLIAPAPLDEANIKAAMDRKRAALPGKDQFDEAVKYGREHADIQGESGAAGSFAFLKSFNAGLAKIAPYVLTAGDTSGLLSKGVQQISDPISESLSKSAAADRAYAELTGRDKSNFAFVANQITGLPLNLLTMGEAGILPGGPVVQFGFLHGAAAIGEGKSGQQILGSTLEGAATGAIFRGAPIAGKIAEDTAPVFKPIAEIAAVGGGTFLLNKAQGSDLTDSFRDALSNALFHTWGMAKEKIAKRTGRAYLDGKSVDYYVDNKGLVFTGLIEGEPENRIVLDPGNEKTIEAVKEDTKSSSQIERRRQVTGLLKLGYEPKELDDFSQPEIKVILENNISAVDFRKNNAAHGPEVTDSPETAPAGVLTRQQNAAKNQSVELAPETIEPVFSKTNPAEPNPPFYSQMEKVIEAKMPARASAEQVKNIIDNPQTGIKQEERDWLKIGDWLNKLKGLIPKEQVLNFIRDHQAAVQDILKQNGSFQEWSENRWQLGNVNSEISKIQEIKNPTPKQFDQLEKLNREKKSILQRYRDIMERRPTFSEKSLPGGKNYRELLLTIPSVISNYIKGEHFTEPNIAVHTRFDDREIRREDLRDSHPELYQRLQAEGRPEAKILHVAEIQSDIHQEGRKEGYKNLPDLPFKNSWHELAFKRILRYAAENGYDLVTWDTGATQNDRYDPRHRFYAIHWKQISPETFRVKIRTHPGAGGWVEVLNADEMGAFLHNHELAQKITLSPKSSGVLKGTDLQVEGRGHKGFYDKILPDFARKYIKKWGLKVGTVEVPANQHANLQIEKNEATGKYAILQHGEPLWKGIWNRGAAERIIKDLQAEDVDSRVPAHSVEITPELRKSVIEDGQPLFAKADTEIRAESPKITPLVNEKGESNLSGAGKSVSTRLKYLAGANESTENILGKSKAELKNGVVLINEHAAELFRRLIGELRGEDETPFLGSYIPPEFAANLADLLAENDHLKSREARAKLAAIEKVFNESLKNDHGDSILSIATKEHPNGVGSVIQEELAHQADYRTRDFYRASREPFENIPRYREAYANVQNSGYQDAPAHIIHNEVIAKTFRDDAEHHLGVDQETIDAIQAKYFELHYNEGKDFAALEKEFGAITGQNARRFLENAKREFERRAVENGRSGTDEILSAGESKGNLRAGRIGGGSEIAPGIPPDKFARIRSGNFSQPAGSKNERINSRLFPAKSNIFNQSTQKSEDKPMPPRIAGKLILQKKALEKYGDQGLDTAKNLLRDNPNLAENEAAFWQQLEAKMRR